MVNLFLDFGDEEGRLLTGVGRRNIIRNQLPSLIEQGYNTVQSLRIFRENGLGIRESDFRAIYREVLGEEQDASRVRFVSRNSIPSESILATYNRTLPTDYRFIVQYDYFDTRTNRIVQSYINYDTDYLDTRGQIEDDAFSDLIERYPDRAEFISNARLIKGFKSQ